MSAAGRTLRAPAATRRGNLGLAVLALVQLGLLALVLLTVARPPKTSSGPLLGKDVTVANITAFTVTGSDGSSVTLKRDGTNWVLPDQGGYPAQNARVKSFLQQLVGLQRSGLVATTADAYKRLKVTKDTYQKKVDLTLKGGGSETLLIGSEPSYGSTHVRLASDKGVYVTHALHASDARSDPSGYVDTTVLSLDQANLSRMEVRNANGDFVFTHGKSGWSMQGLPSGKQLDAHAVSTLAGSLTSLQLDEPLGKTVKPAYGFDKPLAVVTLTTVKPAKSAGASGTSSSGTSRAVPARPAPARAAPARPAPPRAAPATAALPRARPARAQPRRPPPAPPNRQPSPSPPRPPPRPPSRWAPRTRRASTRSGSPTPPTSCGSRARPSATWSARSRPTSSPSRRRTVGAPGRPAAASSG